MLGSLAESPTVRGSVSVCGIGGMNGTKRPYTTSVVSAGR